MTVLVQVPKHVGGLFSLALSLACSSCMYVVAVCDDGDTPGIALLNCLSARWLYVILLVLCVPVVLVRFLFLVAVTFWYLVSMYWSALKCQQAHANQALAHMSALKQCWLVVLWVGTGIYQASLGFGPWLKLQGL